MQNLQVPNMDMSQELQSRLMTFLDFIGNAAKSGADTASQEIPLLLREVATYGAIYGWVMAGLSLILIIITCLLVKYFLGMIKRGNESNDEGKCVFGCIALVLTLGFGLGFGISGLVKNTSNAVKATFAPRLYIVEWGFNVYNGNTNISMNNRR